MVTRLNNFFTELPHLLILGITKGIPGGAVVALAWLFTIPYWIIKSLLGFILGLLPGDTAKPLYKIGDNITTRTAKLAVPLSPALKQVDDLKANRFYRFWAINLLAAVLVGLFLYYLGSQIREILETTDFSLLGATFNASIVGGLIRLEGADPIWLALLKGIANTLILVILGILVATLLGLLVGVARLAKHPLISRFAGWYTELFRNVPLLALMLLIIAIVLQLLPPIESAWTIPRVFYWSNRGLALPRIVAGHDLWWIWVICILVAVVAALYLRRRLILKEQATGGVYHPNRYGFLLFVGIAAITYLILFLAFSFDVPTSISLPAIDDSRLTLRYEGGFVISTFFLAALLGLIFYFSAFIAEIVRGSIQAIHHGQTEAANSLGLSAYQRLTLVILPQAFTIMIPSLNNEYQNVNKDSAVAFAIGYTEVLFVLRQVANERGGLIALLIAGLFIYMFVNLIISAIMNTLNRLNSIAK